MTQTKSERIIEGLRKSFQDKNCKMANRICYGYEVAENGQLVINPTEAEIVRFIFTSYNKGDSLGKIAKQLGQNKSVLPQVRQNGIERQSRNYSLTKNMLEM